MKQKVLVEMSGGVDSSVAALLMKNEGYEVIGVFMKCFSDTKDPLTGECNWRGERRMAAKIASLLDIPLHTVDFEKEYKSLIIKEMINSYKKGITPNPDVDCNNKVKFPLLWKVAKKYKCDYLVTGHYARVRRGDFLKKCPPTRSESLDEAAPSRELPGMNYKLLRAKAENKDQSYFLYRLNQNDLSHTIFPIGNYTKDEVREIARKNKFPNFDKKGTSGICFIGNINVKNYLKKQIKPKKGKILDPEGNVIGEHDGIYFYTVGERIGPRHGIEFEKKGDDKKLVRKWYVARKNVKKNELVLAPEGHVLNFRKEIVVKDLHLISEKELPLKVNVRIRHVGELLPAVYSKSRSKIILDKAITGVSEGQAIVFYKGEICVGGGVIGF